MILFIMAVVCMLGILNFPCLFSYDFWSHDAEHLKFLFSHLKIKQGCFVSKLGRYLKVNDKWKNLLSGWEGEGKVIHVLLSDYYVPDTKTGIISKQEVYYFTILPTVLFFPVSFSRITCGLY